MQLKATIHAIRIDREGETTLILKIPSSDLPKAHELQGMLEQVLDITVVQERN